MQLGGAVLSPRRLRLEGLTDLSPVASAPASSWLWTPRPPPGAFVRRCPEDRVPGSLARPAPPGTAGGRAAPPPQAGRSLMGPLAPSGWVGALGLLPASGQEPLLASQGRRMAGTSPNSRPRCGRHTTRSSTSRSTSSWWWPGEFPAGMAVHCPDPRAQDWHGDAAASPPPTHSRSGLRDMRPWRLSGGG